jgi:hypothetical protein
MTGEEGEAVLGGGLLVMVHGGDMKANEAGGGWWIEGYDNGVSGQWSSY